MVPALVRFCGKSLPVIRRAMAISAVPAKTGRQ